MAFSRQINEAIQEILEHKRVNRSTSVREVIETTPSSAPRDETALMISLSY
jgi:phosphate starvation-inducible protein PhoH